MKWLTADPALVMGKIQKELLLEIGVATVNQAAENCPVDTGLLRNSITFATRDYQSDPGSEPGKAGGVVLPSAGQLIGKPGEKDTVKIGTNVEYAENVEYGDPNNPGYPRQPFLTPPFNPIRRKRRPPTLRRRVFRRASEGR